MNANMTPIDWAKRPLQKYADFSGRAPRPEYWWFVLAMTVLFIVASIIESIIGLNGMILGVYGPLTVLVWVATLLPSLSVAVRRLHDTDRSGWWILLPMVPYALAFALGGAGMASGAGMAALGTATIFLLIGFVCAMVVLVFLVMNGTPGDNRFGPNPYGIGDSGAVAAE